MKAMILAAGRGERLRPITDSIPKPLLEAGSHRLIEYHLLNLAAINIKEVIINVSHLKESIMQALGNGERYGVRIRYSIEEPGPLETGGGIFQALNLGLLDENPFIVLSADIWSALPLHTLPKVLAGDAHLVLVDNPSYHPEGDYGLSEGQATRQSPCLTFGNMSVLHPRLFKDCQPGYFKLATLFNRAIDAGRVTGVHYKGAWFNVGTMDQLENLKHHLSLHPSSSSD